MRSSLSFTLLISILCILVLVATSHHQHQQSPSIFVLAQHTTKNTGCSAHNRHATCSSDPSCAWCSISDWSDNGCCIEHSVNTRSGDFCTCPGGEQGSVGNQLQFFFTLFVFIFFLRFYLEYKRRQELQMLEQQNQQNGGGAGAGGPRVIVRTVVVNEDGTEETLDQAERQDHDTSMFNQFFHVLNQRRLELMMQMQQGQHQQQQSSNQFVENAQMAEMGVVVGEQEGEGEGEAGEQQQSHHQNENSENRHQSTTTTNDDDIRQRLGYTVEDRDGDSTTGRSRRNLTEVVADEEEEDDSSEEVTDERKPIMPRPPLGYAG